MRKVTVTTDGGCNPNPGPGGWGAVFEFENGERTTLSGGEEHTTNNLMELMAAAKAVAHLEEQCEVLIRTDSQLVVNYITREPSKKWNPALMAVRGILVDAVKKHKHTINVLKVGNKDTIAPHHLASAEIAKFEIVPQPMYIG